jgi:WD40 repeat protein/uncharacterized caspase-like protein
VAFSPDGKQVLMGKEDGTAELWNQAIAANNVLRLGGRVDGLESVAFSPDGKQVLVGRGDGLTRLWDVATGKVTRTFEGYQGLFSPNGKQVLTGNPDPQWGARYQPRRSMPVDWTKPWPCRLWDAASGKELRAFPSGVPLSFSPDGKQVLSFSWTKFKGKGVHTLHLQQQNAASAKKIGEIELPVDLALDPNIRQAVYSPNGKHVAIVFANKGVWLWDCDRRSIRDMGGRDVRYTSAVAFSPDSRQVIIALEGGAELYQLADPKLKSIRTFKLQNPLDKVHAVAFSPDGKYVLTGQSDFTARLWRADAKGAQVRVFQERADVMFVAFSTDGKQVLTGSADGSAGLWDTASGRELCRMVEFRDGSWAVVTPDNYYLASRGALDGIAFSMGLHVFPFDQFDLKCNRPDIVLERVGMASKEMIAAYRHAYQKRLKRMGMTEDMLGDDFHVPEVAVTSSANLVTQNATLKLNVKASDSSYLLDRLNVDVNGVPLHGRGGISLRQQPAKTREQEIAVELSAGKNKIDVSVLNEKGAESLKETVAITYDAPPRKPNLYVVAVGVSDYQDERFRLSYADKDARDLADLFESKRGHFGEVKVLRILNREATQENIRRAKEFLKAAQVDDQVVLFFAGHGLLDRSLDYYFATADFDFKDPARRGLPYEAIEDLLDGTRARKKLLLMDTCHSGELDKEGVQVTESGKKPDETIKVRAFRGLDLEIAPKVGLDNSYQLLQSVFADLRRGTGAVVISSAGGAEYALESATWKNGVFTHAVLRGLKGEADRNRDGRVQVSELRDFVEQEVSRLTQGRQTPTARRENLAVDFPVD